MSPSDNINSIFDSGSASVPIMSATGSISNGEKPEAVSREDVEKPEQHEVYELTPEEDKALLRKIDLW